MLVGVQGLTGGVAVSLQCRHRTEPSALLFGKVSEQEVAMFGRLFRISVAVVPKYTFPGPPWLADSQGSARTAISRIQMFITDAFIFFFPLFFFFFLSIHQIESGRHGEPRAPASPGF